MITEMAKMTYVDESMSQPYRKACTGSNGLTWMGGSRLRRVPGVIPIRTYDRRKA
jgi:hypothetical protein